MIMAIKHALVAIFHLDALLVKKMIFVPLANMVKYFPLKELGNIIFLNINSVYLNETTCLDGYFVDFNMAQCVKC